MKRKNIAVELDFNNRIISRQYTSLKNKNLCIKITDSQYNTYYRKDAVDFNKYDLLETYNITEY